MPHPRSLDSWLRRPMSRRSLLSTGAALFALRRAHVLGQGSGGNPPRWSSDPFTLGVASGDPSPSGVVLWTRLAPDPLNGGGMPAQAVDVQWELASDEAMTHVVKRGTAKAEPMWGHSVHVEVEGLDSDRWYWYRFRAGDAQSGVARTRTLPKRGARVDRLRFAFASCQHLETGFFTAYKHLSEEELDLVFHLGDYIYESAPVEGRVRTHRTPKPMTLADYRNRYAQYKLDPHLQAAHARFPWFVTWDDHEVENNYAGLVSGTGIAAAQFADVRGFAYHAYYEHMPLRHASIPNGPSLQLYRGLEYGSLASFFILDTRQFRTDQPCGDGNKAPCDGSRDPNATLLGRQQEDWLFKGMGQSKGQWNVIPQQVMMARVDQFPGEEQRFSMDQWPGYASSLDRMMRFLGTARPSNPVVLTGDIHTNWVNDLKLDFTDEKSPVVGTELVGTSISSGGDGGEPAPRIAGVLSENAFVKFYNNRRGYVSCTMTPRDLRADYQTVEFVSRPGAPKTTAASFVIEDKRPGAQRL